MSSPVSSLTASRSSSPEPPVQPDHFYNADPLHLPPSPDSEGKGYLSPDDDPLAHRGIPVFKPSMHEFADFEGYMNRVEAWGRRSGIVKVVPPKEWKDALPDVKPQLAGVKIKSPIEQFMRGRAGLFRQENMEKRKLMSVREWAELCAKDEFRAPGKDQVGKHNNPSALPALRSRKKKPKTKDEDQQEPLAMASPPNSASPDPEDTKPDASSKARNRRTERADKDTSFLETFSPHTDWLPPGTTAADYTPDFCAKLERAFWRNCGLGKPAWYGADTMGSLYTDETTAWNVAHLPSTLSRLLPPSQGLPGVNTPYLYFGMWRATFAWHVEDMDLFSINYIHFGAPKFWYAVPQARAGALEDTMRGYFPKDTSQCPQFLRHKSFLASPTLLAQSAVRPNHLVQHAGEFVITYPRGYHAGFNLGLNCAESVNFALDSWLDEGRKAAVCKCVDFSVRIDVDQLLEDRRIEELEKTDPAAAARARAVRDGVDEEQYMDAIPVELQLTPLPAPVQPTKPRSPRKRKPTMPFEPEGASPKRPRTTSAPSASTSSHPHPHTSHKLVIPAASSSSSHHSSSHGAAPPAQRLTLKLGPRPTPLADETFPCCLCVDPSPSGLARVHDLPAAWREVAPAAQIHFPASTGGKGVWMAHEACAVVLPETWVDEINGEKLVFGVDGIVRGRWSLKCSACTRARPKAHGALIQCTKGKCPKAFHINCAKAGHAAGIAYSVVREVEKEVVLLEPVPHADPADGEAEPNLRVLKVIRKSEVEALCPQHNPVIVAERRASKQSELRTDILALPPLSRIKVRVSSGVFEVTLLRVLEDKGAVEVLWDAAEVREVKWGSILLGVSAQSVPAMSSAMGSGMGTMGSGGGGGRPKAIAPAPAQAPEARAYYQYASAGASASAPAAAGHGQGVRAPSIVLPPCFPNTTASSSSSASNHQTGTQTQTVANTTPGQQAQAQNPYGVFKYEYWPYPYGAQTASGGATGSASANAAYSAASGAHTANATTPSASTSAATRAVGTPGATHVPGTHYATQYYTGPQPWSSQYYRPAPAYYPQVQQFQAQGQTTAAASASAHKQQPTFAVQPQPAAPTPASSTSSPNPNPIAASAPAQNPPIAAAAVTTTPAPNPAPTPNPIATPTPSPQPPTPTAPAPNADAMHVDVEPPAAAAVAAPAA
ncbi:JmjC domain, hydroxylase-domain-containing protein [Mycena capillaripes]|nr:JmjC domain, hydroxylase-domain-containing protein [Mycena capillaripes]